LNALIVQLWPNICVAGSRIIKDAAEPMLASMLPPPLNSLRFTKIDFGKVPIHFVNIDVHKTDAGGIKLVMDLDWDGVCDIELNAEKLPKIVSFRGSPMAART